MTNRPARRRCRRALGTWSLAALLLVGGCTDASEETGAVAGAAASTEGGSTTVRVLQPGRPGEAAREVEDPGQVAVEESWNHADAMFMQMMIPHHAQALEMARLARSRAEDARVSVLAERIRAAQGPEIRMMAAWLDERGVEVPRAAEDPAGYDHAAHGHAGMKGMLTAEEMDRLRSSRGRAFDRLFLTGMIAHHRGALAMVDDVVPEGVDVRVSELAADVAATQAAEIARMKDLLRVP